MKKATSFLYYSLVALSLTFLTLSCGGAKQLATVPQKVDGLYAARQQALLWEIKSKDLKETSYLFGTMHMIPEEDYFMPEYIQRSIKDSEHVYFEISMDEMNDMSSIMGLMDVLFLENGVTLKDLYSEEDYQKVKKKLAEIPMLSMFGEYAERMKPFFLSMLIEQTEIGSDPTGGDIRSYEIELGDIAKQNQKPISGLETMDFQISLFDRIPLEEQAQMLLNALTLDEVADDSAEDQMDQMIQMYKDQDVAGLHKMVVEHAEDNKEFEKTLLNERNHNWIPLMAEQMKKEGTFFAVGAAHLGGEEGVIALLRKQGYIVNPVLK